MRRARRLARARPQSWVQCADCGIGFWTAPSNRGRRDLRCPWGCREQHRRRQSTNRSGAYYRTQEGQTKKQDLNRRRSRPRAAASPSPAATTVVTALTAIRADLVAYGAFVVRSLGVPMEKREIRERMERSAAQATAADEEGVRQHSLARDGGVVDPGLKRDSCRSPPWK